MNGVCVIIPAFNEESTIENVIREVHAVNASWQIVVINDGSFDLTESVALNTGLATVISLCCNLGIGGSVQTGFKYAYRHEFSYVVQLDADGQHIASEIPALLKPLKDLTADVVIGSRFVEKNNKGFRSTLSRRIGIWILEQLNALIISQRIKDNTSGFRAYNRRALEHLTKYYPTDYPEPESVIELGKNGFRIAEQSVVMRKRQGGTSSIKGLFSVYYMLKVILSILFVSVRKTPPQGHNV